MEDNTFVSNLPRAGSLTKIKVSRPRITPGAPREINAIRQ